MAEDRLTAPKPLEEHRKLSAFAGEWTGEETVFPSRWVEGGKATSRVSARMDLNGTNYRELTSAFTNDTLTNALTWSRDGQKIFFVDRSGRGGDRVMQVAKDGGDPVFTGVQVSGLRHFDISPDGTRLVYGTSNPEGSGMLHSTLDVRAMLASRP